MKFNKAAMLTEGKKDKLLLLDIDDTLVKAQDIHIYKKTKNGEIPLTPDEFAKEDVKTDDNYDFRDFRDAKKVADSIKKGKPIKKTLEYMDRMISKGYKVGILTARGMEEVIRDTMFNWLMYMKRDKLKNISNKLKEVFAINDDKKQYQGKNSFEKKANVIKSLTKKYNEIIFVDDDEKNIKAVNDLHLKGVKAKNVEDV